MILQDNRCLTFYHSFLQSEINQITTVENLFDLSENTTTILHEDQKLSIKWFSGYQSKQTLYQSRYALLNNQILLIVSSGSPSLIDIRMAGVEFEKIQKQNNLIDIDVIWDTRQIKNASIKIRKSIISLKNRLSKFWDLTYLIATPRQKTLIRIFKLINKNKGNDLFVSNSIGEAVSELISKKPISSIDRQGEAINTISRENLLGRSKEELVDLIEKYQQSYKTSTNKVLEAIGHISWGGKFKESGIEVSSDDPHFELVNAFSLLQNDVAEIIRDYKELNQNLELKVAERIVDFIDKESNLRSILDNSDRVTWLLNNRYELIDFNLAFSNSVKQLYKRTPKLNQNILEVVNSEKEREVWKDRFDSALQGKAGIYLDQDTRLGFEQVWEIKIFPIKEIGKIKGVSVFVEDITELKDSQFKLIQKNRDLQKVNSELDSFVYRVSHDLRAPLTSILGLISLMKIETSHDKVVEYIDLQERSIKKLDLFIKEIINLSRNSRLGITVSQIDFKGLLDEIFEGQSYTKAAYETKRICEIDENLELFTDRQRLSIILNNLISNSLKYTNPYEKASFVKVKVYSDEEDVIIEVIDNGTGISEVYLPKIFEMFFRATQEFAGSGLGLYIVKETVEKLRGRISVKSKVREGTKFKVRIPNLKDRFDSAPKLDD